MSPARPLAVGALVASAFLGGTADAACVGTANTATACNDLGPRVVYEDCVYVASSSCTPVQVVAPACFYGTIGTTTTWQTVWC